jgi:hypothetical protein
MPCSESEGACQFPLVPRADGNRGDSRVSETIQRRWIQTFSDSAVRMWMHVPKRSARGPTPMTSGWSLRMMSRYLGAGALSNAGCKAGDRGPCRSAG